MGNEMTDEANDEVTDEQKAEFIEALRRVAQYAREAADKADGQADKGESE
jgi:hypothetical protein